MFSILFLILIVCWNVFSDEIKSGCFPPKRPFLISEDNSFLISSNFMGTVLRCEFIKWKWDCVPHIAGRNNSKKKNKRTSPTSGPPFNNAPAERNNASPASTKEGIDILAFTKAPAEDRSKYCKFLDDEDVDGTIFLVPFSWIFKITIVV